MSAVKKEEEMELLAPAGTLAVFETAVDMGADAVYVGVPAFNARAVGRDFSLVEIAAMISHAHNRGIKVYLAMNSLLKENEIPLVIDTLVQLSALNPDGLIIQDLGAYYLVRKYFPEFRIHASTLMGAHNSLAVKKFEKMGFSRVVLARELTLKEISRIHDQCPVELEVFVHGALCFSYSGLCLFSSYQGGKSGLRGRCVQPCRRRYSWGSSKSAPVRSGRVPRSRTGPQSGYFFSMNDLSAIDLLPDLQKAGVTSLKIEGRLRSAQYVGTVVKAYKMVLDAMANDKQTVGEAVSEASGLLGQAMGRRTTSGYFTAPQSLAAISPYHSGNIGKFIGRVKQVGRDGLAYLTIREKVRIGDRLRLHQEESGERFSFTLKKMLIAEQKISHADKGDKAAVQVPHAVRSGDSLYKVDTLKRRELEKVRLELTLEQFSKKKRQLLDRSRVEKVLRSLGGKDVVRGYGFAQADLPHPLVTDQGTGENRNWKRFAAERKRSVGTRTGPLKLWFKVDDPRQLKQHQHSPMPARVILVLDRFSLNEFLKNKKYLGVFLPKLVWALPPVIQEGQIVFYKKAVKQLIRAGFHTWQIGHISQCEFFASEKKVSLLGDYTLNVLNTLSLQALQEFGLRQAQVAIDIDRECLWMICSRTFGKGLLQMGLGMTVYGMPPLFTARLVDGHFKYDRPFVSPKGEELMLKKRRGLTLAFSTKPFSLLPKLQELAALDLQYVVVDLSHMKLKEKEMEYLRRQLSGKAKGAKLSSFNYLGVLR